MHAATLASSLTARTVNIAPGTDVLLIAAAASTSTAPSVESWMDSFIVLASFTDSCRSMELTVAVEYEAEPRR